MPLTEHDRKLLTDLLSGHSEAWKTFIDRFSGLIIHVIRGTAAAHSLGISAADEDDLCAEVIGELVARDMGALRRFRGRSSLATYLAVVARRVVVRKLTERRYQQALGHVRIGEADLSQRNSESGKRAVDARDEVESLMEGLPPGERALARAAFLEERSYRTLSRRFRLPLNSLGPLLHRLKEKLATLAGRPEMIPVPVPRRQTHPDRRHR